MKKNKDYYSDWGSEDLKQFRSKLGVTQAVMSEKLGLSSRMYRYYESGNMKISKYLEYAVRWIVEKSNLSRETKKELENLLRAQIGDSIGISGVATWKAGKPRKIFDKDKFREKHPDLYQKFVIEKRSTRVVRITEAK